MRTIKRLNLDKLAENMPVIPEIKQRNFVGGDGRYTVRHYPYNCVNDISGLY